MKRFFLTVFVFYLSNFLVSDEKKIEDCTLIANDEERLSCFDSFFKTDKKLILVDQDDIAIFQEKIEDTNGDDDKVIVKAPRSVINDNLVLVGVRLSGRDYLFELNDKSVWKNIETIRKKDIPTPGDKVILETGLFGSMFLKIKGEKNKIRIKKVRNP